MNAQKNISYGTPSLGCYLDQGYYNNDELSAAIIDIAVGYGMPLDTDTVALLAMTDDEIEASDDYSEQMDWASEAAIDWLNEQETRSFLYWANEGEANAFGLWANIEGAKEDCGFVTKNYRTPQARKAAQDAGECSADDSDYPSADYRGEWLHVSDHGNVTLYVRESRVQGLESADNYTDVEIWSVV